MKTFISADTLLDEYKKRFPYDENFLKDEVVKQIVVNSAKLTLDEMLECAEMGLKASGILLDLTDPSPESVPHRGDPIGRRGPSFPDTAWAGITLFGQIKEYINQLKSDINRGTGNCGIYPVEGIQGED